MSPPAYPSAPPVDPREAQPPVPPGVNGFALASLLLAIFVPCLSGPLSAIFGIVALAQINTNRQRGKSLAIGGLAATGVWGVVIAIGIIIGLSNLAERDGSGDIAEAGRISMDNLAPGDCVNDLAETERLGSLPAVPCAEPHEGEVYALFDLNLDGDWPGEEAIASGAGDACLDRLADYSQAAWSDDRVDIFYLLPSRGSWRAGDREIICIAYFLDGRRTGSLTG